MPNKTAFLLVLTSFFPFVSPCLADKEQVTSPEALISRARQVEEVWTEGTPPMQIRAEIQVLGSKGDLISGSYFFAWSLPSRWSEEIQFPGYDRIRVGDLKGYWQKSGLEYQPESIFQLDLLLHLKEALKVGSKQTLGKTKNHEKKGIRQKCTEVKWPRITEKEMCFDGDKGTLESIDYPTSEFQNPPAISRIEYSSFTPVAGKLVPYEMRALKGKSLIAAVKILEVSPLTQENASLFSQPENSQFWAQCDSMQEASLADHVQPIYPASARASREQGTVIFYAVIEADGSLSHLTIIWHAAPELEAAALEAVRHWRYKPLMCGQSPTRMETSIPVDFWIGK